jgi:hypothetical protein
MALLFSGHYPWALPLTGSMPRPGHTPGDADGVPLKVLDAWMSMQIRLMTQTQASFNGPFIRIYAYSGVVAYAAVQPSMGNSHPYHFPLEKLNQFPTMPGPEKDKPYYWPASLNAALAYINRSMFPMASDVSRRSVDSLEKSFHAVFAGLADSAVLGRSENYGREVAAMIYQWAETDGYKQGNGPYEPPRERGNWKPTAPAYGKPVSPYWGKLRTIVPGSIDGSEPPPPPPYSEDTASVFYRMVKQVYEVSGKLTEEQKRVARFWRDVNPGVTATGHWLNILRLAMKQERTTIEKAVFAYAVSGIALNDSWISSWKTRYTYNVQRPITYIQTVMGHKDWMPFIPTPPHPEYPGGHAALSASVAEVLSFVFGDSYALQDDTYAQVGLGTRSYPSFRAIAEEAAISKVYGGIHYQLSVEVGLEQGRKVSREVLQKILQPGSTGIPVTSTGTHRP